MCASAFGSRAPTLVQSSGGARSSRDDSFRLSGSVRSCRERLFITDLSGSVQQHLLQQEGAETGMARKTYPIQINLHPGVVPRAVWSVVNSASPFPQAFCSAVWMLWAQCKILLITFHLLKEQRDNCEYHQCEQNMKSS